MKSKRTGFTLVEVLVALLLVMVLVGVTGQGLITVLNQEQRGAADRQAALLIETVACRHFLGLEPDPAPVVLGAAWSVAQADLPPSGGSLAGWVSYQLAPAARPAAAVDLDFMK